MAISGGALPSAGGKRSLDAEINLVPFIDLLSMCICFLLITAVWIQVGSVQVKQSKGTDAPASAQETLDLSVRFSSSSALELLVLRGAKILKKVDIRAEDPEKLALAVDQGVAGLIASYGSTTGSQLFGSAMLTPKNGVSYGSLIQVMDALRKHQIVNLGVVPVASEK